MKKKKNLKYKKRERGKVPLFRRRIAKVRAVQDFTRLSELYLAQNEGVFA